MGAIAIVAITAIACIPSMHGGFIWDDDDYVVNRTVVHDPGGLADIWFQPRATPQYYPMVFTTFWIEHRLWGLHPTGYHIVNVALHILNSLLLWLILRRLGFGDAVSWVAAAIFAVHPVHVESVAWITERKNVLSGLFYLASLFVGVSVFRLEPTPKQSPSSTKPATKKAPARHSEMQAVPVWRLVMLYLMMLALFAAALLSKTVTCSLPAVMLLLIWWKRGRVSQLEVLALVPMFIIGVTLALHTVEVEKHHVGVEVLNLDYSFVERCLIAGRAIWFYAGKLVWPDPIVFIYPRWHIRAEFWWLYAYPLAVATAIVALWLLRKRLGRGPLVAALIFCGTLVPALGFIDVFPMVYSLVADHFQYLASISLIVLVVATAAHLLRKWPRVTVALAAIVLCVFGVLTWREGAKYENLVALWTDTVTKNHHAAMAHINLGNQLNLADTPEAWEQARSHYTAALTLNDPAIHPLVLSRAHYGMGQYWLAVNNTLAALEEYQAAVQLQPGQPMPHYGVGIAHAAQGKLDEALAAYNRALALRPNLAQAVEARQRLLDYQKSLAPPR
jgi:tetratricopeptide (TPR) repeat protein